MSGTQSASTCHLSETCLKQTHLGTSSQRTCSASLVQCNGAGGRETAGSGRTTTAAFGTSSSRQGGTATHSMGISMANLVGATWPRMSSSSSVARTSRFCLAVPLRSPHRRRLLSPHRLRRLRSPRRHLRLLSPHLRRLRSPHRRLRLLSPHLHLHQNAASGQTIAAEAARQDTAAKAKETAMVAAALGAKVLPQ